MHHDRHLALYSENYAFVPFDESGLLVTTACFKSQHNPNLFCQRYYY
jgi:hypothetical protein